MLKKASTRVGVLAGGDAVERGLSLQSGRDVVVALNRRGWNFVDLVELDEHPDDRARQMKKCFGGKDSQFDVAFYVMYGKNERGDEQGFLETLRVPYTFSSVFTASVGGNKLKCKRYLLGCGALVNDGDQENTGSSPADQRAHAVPSVALVLPLDKPLSVRNLPPFPVMVKDPNLGSSKGVWRCDSEPELTALLERLQKQQSEAGGDPVELLVEKFVVGTDIVVCLAEKPESEKLDVWPVIEFDMDPTKFQDLATKNALWGWDDDGGAAGSKKEVVVPRCPATKIPPETCEQAQREAKRIFKAIEASGALNIEFRVDHITKALYFIEMSVVPGMTSGSVHAATAAKAGVSYDELCERILRSAKIKSKF